MHECRLTYKEHLLTLRPLRGRRLCASLEVDEVVAPEQYPLLRLFVIETIVLLCLSPPYQAALDQAAEKSANHDWMTAASLYSQVINQLRPEYELLQVARNTELLANCYFNAAFQADNRIEFKKRVHEAAGCYQKTAALYSKAGIEALSKKSEAREQICRILVRR